MKRRSFLQTIPPFLLGAYAVESLDAQSGFSSITAISEPHFPNRLYQFVWRNWELANLDRMAQVVQATPDQLATMAKEMGLPEKRPLSEDYLKRIYITVIRQNWHLLPEPQIIQLLGWTTDHYQFTLKEDDFLDHKLGRVKPVCDPLAYQKPSPDEQQKAASIRTALSRSIQGGVQSLGQQRFTFVESFSQITPGPGWNVTVPENNPALAVAAKRFGSGEASGKSVEIILSEQVNGFSLIPSEKSIRLIASAEHPAIQALYFLRNQQAWPESRIDVQEKWKHRFLYSYFALYGDPLMEGDAAGLPDGYLDQVAANGMNGVWLQGVLNNLAPSKIFPEFGQDWEIRIRNLRLLAERAKQFGLKIYLYLNEPRAMPAAFFQKYPDARGTAHQDVYAMCTSTPQVRAWLKQSISHVFREVPELGGVFTITMSENHTNCFSHGGAWGDRDPVAKDCPRCSKRTGAETIAEFIQTIRDGIREHSDIAEVMSYDWGWGTPLAKDLIPRLPKDSSIISISEWAQPVFRGGVKTEVGEYSMSVVGPGPRASANWKQAQQHGVSAIAKTQFNNTWEISAVPYIPVLPLVLDHAENLAKVGITGVMASWTCGGYPSSNLWAASAYGTDPHLSRQQILETEAARIYGKKNISQVIRAWDIFSEAFQTFPYGVSIYVLPVQHGPANPLRLHATKLSPGMILFPYDDYSAWKGAYPPSVMQGLLLKLSRRWKEGVALLEKIDIQNRKEAVLELAIARTCYTHFASVANQIQFYLLRDELPITSPQRRAVLRKRMIQLAQDEKKLALLQYEVASGESLIGYEASNHYYYTPVDLLEKILNCNQVIDELKSAMG